MKKILWGILILVSLVVSGCGAGGKVNEPVAATGGTGTGGTGTGDTTLLAVSSTVPIDGATGVASSQNFKMFFNKDLDAATVVPSSFTVSCGAGATSQSPQADFTVSYDSTGKSISVVTPGGWPVSQVCTVTAKSGNLKDLNAVALATSVSFSFSTTVVSVGPQPDGSLTLSADKTALIADGSGTSTLTSTLSNVDGVSGPAAGKNITFNALLGTITTPDADLVVPGVQVVTGNDGKAIINYKAGNIAGTGNVTATYGALTASTAIALNPAPPSTLDVAFNKATPNPSGPLGLVSSKQTTLYARVKDGNGNLLNGYPVSFVLSNNQSGAILNLTSAVTDASGWAEVVYVAGIVNSTLTDTITISAGSLSQTLTINVLRQDVATINIAPPSAPLTANGNDTSFLVVTVLDPNEDPAVGKVVTVVPTLGTISTPDADPLTPGRQVIVNASGQAKIAYKAGVVSGVGSVTITCEGIDATATITLQAGAPTQLDVSFDMLTFAPPALSLVSGKTIPLYAQVKDVYGNLVPDEDVNFVFNGVDNKSDATDLSPSIDKTDNVGVATVSYTAGTNAPNTDKVTISVAGIIKTLSINVLQKPVGSVALTGTANLIANGADANPLSSQGSYTAVVKDISGNVLKDKTVTFYSIGGGTFDDQTTNLDGLETTVVTDELGEATINYTAPAALGDVVIYAMAGIKRSADVKTALLNGPPASIRLFPMDTKVGPGGTTDIVAKVVDLLGYPVAGKTVNLEVLVPTLPATNSGVLDVFLGAPVTDATGKVTVSTYKAGTTPAFDTIQAKTGTIATTKQIEVTLSASRIKSFAATTTKTTLIADGTDYAKLTVKVIDNNDLGVAGTVVTFRIDTGSLDLDTTVGGGLTTQNVTTGSNGEAVVYVFSAVNEMTAGRVSISASSGDYVEQNYSYVAGTAATVALNAAPSTIAPYGETILTAVVKDAAGNPVEGDSITFQITTNTSGGKLSALTATTTIHGEATVTYSAGNKSALAGDILKATSSNAKVGTRTVIVDPSAIIIGSVALAAEKTELTADGLSTSVLTATVLDIDGNPAVGQSVTFGEALSGGAIAGVKVPAVMSATTDASGQAKLTYTAGIKSGLVQLAATCTGVGSTVEITLNPGAPAQLDVSFDNITYNPAASFPLFSGTQTLFYAKVLDVNGNPVRGASVNFSMSLAADHPSQGWFTCGVGVPADVCSQYNISGVTGGYGSGDGIIEAIYTAGTTGNVIDTITVTLGGLTQTYTQTLKVNVKPRVAAMTLTYNDKITAAPPAVSGGQSIKIYARAFSDAAKTIPAANVDVTVAFPLIDDNKSGATLTPLTAKTDAEGYVIITYTAGEVTTPVSDRVAISAGGFETDAIISVVAKVASIAITYGDLVTTPATSLVAGQTLTIYAKVMDGNTPAKPVAGISVDFGFPLNGDNKSGASFSPTSAITDANGVASVTFTAGPTKTAVTDTLTVTAGGFSQTGSIDIKPAVASIKLYYTNLSTSVPVAPGTILTGSGASTIVYAQVLDGLGDPVAGVTVSFAFTVGTNLSGATISPSTFVTDAKGFASATYIAGAVSGGNDELTVSVGDVTSAAIFKVDPVVATIEFDKTEIIVGGAPSTDTLTFTLKNQLGLLMANTAFQVIAGGSVNPSVVSGNTLADGTYTLLIDDLAGENTTLTITAGGQSKTIPVYAGATLELTPASANAPADGVTNLIYTVNLRDFAGVVLPGIQVRFSGLNKVILSNDLATTDASGNASVNVRSTIFTPTDGTKEVTVKAGALTAAADAVFEPGPAKDIVLSVPALANPLSLGGATTITAVITDALGNPVKAGTVVNFALDGTIGSVTGQAVTADATGTVAVPFQGGMKSGNVTVTATSGDANSTIGLTIKPSDAGIIELSGVEPTTKMINIRGSGMTQSATIYFIVKDGAGNPVADGTVVNFTLPIATVASVAAGGEAIATTTLFAETVNGTTVNGIASVTLRSGKLARTVGVVAKVTVGAGTISTEARVAIVGGQPDSRHISLATERYNTAGGITFGLQNSITALLGDRFSNIPIDGTPVSFYSECGTIGDSAGFVLSSVGGQVVAKMTTQNPTTPNLAGVGGSGNVGMCTVLAAMPGEEYYDDFDGDGVYTAGVDSCSGDQGEPYIDGNDSGAYELGEFFVDSNNNGSWNGPDGVCSSSTMIWDDITVMMSSYPAALNVTPVYFTIPIGGFQEFNLNLTDIFGNAPVAGTSLKISADGGTLGGTIDYTVPDYAGVGNWYSEDSNGNGGLDANDRGVDIDGDGIPDPGVPVRFWLSADTKADAEAKAVKITITRSPAPASPAGTDGIVQTITISGTINTPASWSRMSVSSNAYSLSAGTGTANVTAMLTDAIGWPVQGATVNFNTNPAGALQYGTFAPASGVTDANGQVSTTFTAGQLGGFVDLVASAAGGDYVGSTSIRVIPSAATKVTLSLSDPVITAGGLVTANALVQDAYDNPVADQTVTFSTLTNNSVGNLSAGSATTNSFGIATVTYTAGSDLASGTETDTLRASVGAINGDAALIVTTPAAAAKSLQLNLATSSMVANGTATTTATAYVSDSADPKIPGQPVQGVEVLFSTTLGTIPVSAFTNASGVATATLTAATVPGSGTVQASVGVLSATADFTLIPGPAATLTNILAFPATVKPSGNSTISVRVVDATGNAVADGTFVSFAVTTNNSGGYLLATSATTVSGNASVVYKAGNTSLIDTITISSNPAASLPVNVTVNSGLSSIDAMIITTSSSILRNNGTDAVLITATVTKAGVPVDGIDVSFANAGVAGSLFTTGAVPYAGAIFTDSNGEAQVVFKAGVVQGTATVTATFGATNATAVLTIIDKVANIVVTSDDATIVADGAMTTDVTATVTDMVGVPLSGITLNLNTTRGTLSAGPYITNASGQVTATLTSTAITGTALVTANYGTITDTEPVQFDVGPPATVTMTGSPTTLPYGAQTSLTVQVLDSQLRPVPNANLYFGFSPSAVLGNLSGGSYSLTSGTTDAQGRLTLTYTSGDVAAIDTLLVETEEGGVDATLTIDVDPATAEIGNMILSVPTFPSIVANGVTATQLTATVTDSFGAPMNGVPVSFASTFGAIDTDGTPLTKTVPTSTLGTATVTLTSTTTIGTAYVTAVTGGFQEQQRIDFIPGNPVWKKADNVTIVSTLTPVNGSLAADGSSTTEVTAVLKDINGNLVADGTNVTLLSTMGSVVTNPITTSNGVATFTVKAPKTTGTADLSISTVPGLTAAIQFGVNSGANIGALTLNAVASNITVSGAGQPSSTTITIQAVESDGTPIDEAFWGANNTVRLSLISHPGGGEFVAGTGGVCSDPAFTTESTCVAALETWDAGQYVTTSTSFIDVRTSNGTATVTLQAGTLPGVIEIKATALDENGALTTVTASLPNITVAAGPVHSIVLIPGPSVVNATNSSLFGRNGTIIATDRFGNAVPDGTELNLGLVDTIISADTAGTAITTASTNTLTGAFVNTLVRAVQSNDRVLIPTADAVDRNRFIASGTVSPFTVTQNYNVTGSWNAYIGAATQGGYVSGGSGEIGRTTTTNGIAALNVSYPAALTITAPARGYGCGVIPVLNVSEGVFVVVTSNVGGVTTVNQAGFCFAP